MTTVVVLFEHTRDADRALSDLTNMGFQKQDIGVMARQNVLDQGKREGFDPGTSAGVGAVSGTAIGGIAGLLAGLGALAIPGIGTTALGAGIGAAAGGVVGALTGMGLSHDEAHFYAEGVKRGGILLTVNAQDAQVAAVTSLLQRDNAMDVNTRRQQWQQQDGWQRFDENSPAPHVYDDQTGSATNQNTRNTGANAARSLDRHSASSDPSQSAPASQTSLGGQGTGTYSANPSPMRSGSDSTMNPSPGANTTGGWVSTNPSMNPGGGLGAVPGTGNPMDPSLAPTRPIDPNYPPEATPGRSDPMYPPNANPRGADPMAPPNAVPRGADPMAPNRQNPEPPTQTGMNS